MINIIKHSWLMFKKSPGYIHSMTTMPIFMLLFATVLLAYSNNHNIAVIDHSNDGTGERIQQALSDVEGFTLVKTPEEEAVKKMMAGNIELVAVLQNQGKANLISLSTGTEIEQTVKTIIQAVNAAPGQDDIQVEINAVKKKTLNISNAMGIMLFKFITAASTMAGLLIHERNNGMRGRIFLSGINTFSYLSGKALISIATMTFTALVYYIFCLLFRFDFGMNHTIYFFLLIVIANIFSAGFFALLSSLLKDEGALWSISTFIFFPMAIMSGALFPYQSMPSWMQKVGNFVPQRWVSGSIEAIQKYDSIVPALPYIGLLLGTSVLCYGLALFNTSRKRGAF
ncbi:ABC transporter permease [Paenibacillaceae bacterium]|nr:ABC transporter permease [Paenibacillaceae bacterium]